MMNDAMMLMKSRHNNTKQYLTGSARRAFALLLLLGAISFVNTQQIQAQSAEQLAAMPNAFETIDPNAHPELIGNGQYYYIQFYGSNFTNDFRCYLTDCGASMKAKTKDFLPSANRLWTLIAANDGNNTHFKLKSKEGRYLAYLGGLEGLATSKYRLGCVTDPANATIMTCQKDGDDYFLSTADDLSNIFYRVSALEWASDLAKIDIDTKSYARMRIAKLKDNAAFIIYYRGEGVDNATPGAEATRHYLTYSGVDYGTNSLIDNGTLELTDNYINCFFSPNGGTNSTIENGIGREGTRGIRVLSTGTEANETDVQFFIKATSVIPIGTKVRVDFDYKAGVNVNGISTQAHALPSQYNHWDVIGSIDFTTNWQHFSKEFTVTEDMGNNEGQGRSNTFQTIAFNLGKKAETTYYFDNIVFTIEDADVSSRQSIIPKDKSLWTLPTAAAYHQDGLWALEESGDNGEFYIKKYGTEEYLNLVQSGGTYYSDLGTKDAINGKYKLEDANANRYTAIQNAQYATTTLSSDAFSGPVSVTFNVNNGTTFSSSGVVVAGTSSVDYQTYADLTGNTKMVINGTPGVPLRVLMNRQESNTGPLVEKYVTIGDDGKAVVDLTDLELNYSLPSQQATVKMTYVNGSDGTLSDDGVNYLSDNRNTSYGEIAAGNPAYCGYNIIRNGSVELRTIKWGVNNVAYLQVDASAVPGTIKKVTLTGDFQQIAARPMEYGVGYNSSEWSSTMTWNTADRSITTMGGTWSTAKATADVSHSFDITDAFRDGSKKRTILVYNLAAGAGYIKNPTVTVEYSPDVTMNYVHLNAIKTGYGAFSGTISSITLLNENNISSTDSRYLHYDKGDGYLVKQWSTKWNDCWYAGFYPVEVPVPNKDNYYQVLVHIPVVSGNPILNYTGWADGDETKLWQLEQVGDYRYFRLKKPSTGEYLAGVGKMTQPNDPDGAVPTVIGDESVYYKAEINDNKKFLTDFSLTWVYQNPTPKEIVVNGYVRHKVSYLKAYADKNVITDQDGLRKQGLSRDVDSDWKETENKVTKKPFLLDGFIQKTNYFEITHYLKKGDSRVIEFPTVLNHNNDHIFFQRFYNYNEDDTQMDLANLKAHVSLDTRDDGDVQYFLYKNGMVTGQKLDWTGIDDGGMAHNEQRRFNFTNSDGKTFNVGIDVARYSDLEYKDETINEVQYNNLYEPSLTMRYLFYMNDAKEMATKLTACPKDGDKWLESKEFHFGRTQVPYTKFKKVGYRGEFIPIRHIFSDYWVYDDPEFVKNDANGKAIIDTLYIKNMYGEMTNEQLGNFLDQHLVSAVNDNSSGKIVVEVVPGNTGIRKGGYNTTLNLNDEEYDDSNDNENNYQGFYFYDKLSPNPKTEYGNSRFVVFRYPKADANGIVQVANCGPENPAYINVYLDNGGTKYQLAQFKLIFDANMATRPWTEIKNGTHYANGVNQVKGSVRDPNQLRAKAGKPIAKVTFDFPKKMNISDAQVDATYHYPSESVSNSTDGITKHNGGNNNPGGTIANSSPVPLTFGHTNYAFDGDDCNWGSYAIVTQKRTAWGNGKTVVPADDDTYGYGLPADDGMQKAFMYIDASEQPGDICAVDFEGEFCANDQLMCTGWISGSNKIRGDTRCPGSITLTVKGEDKNGNSNTIYRFCPGQIYELDNGYEMPGATTTNVSGTVGNAGIDGNGNGATHVVWQQFYFEFSTDQKYERYWLEVNNNCVSSNGGDFMIDNVEVYTIVPEVEPEVNTPLCVKRDGDNLVYDMRFLKLKVDHRKLLSSITKNETTSTPTSQTPYLGFVFLDKVKFLTMLRQQLGETNVSLEEMAERVESGYYDNTIDGASSAYQAAFREALVRSNNSTAIWKSDAPSTNLGAGVLYFQWDKTFSNMEPYSFYKAVNKTKPTFRESVEGVDYIIMNGNYPQLPWKTNTEYYIVPSNTVITDFSMVYDAFNICSNCSKASTFQIEPPYTVLGLESSESTNDHVVCEGQIPTMLLDLKGYDLEGNEVDMKDLNYDWWLGNETTLATLEKYHIQSETIDAENVKLDEALATLRAYYPDITSLDGIVEHKEKTPYLTVPMIKYLQKLVAKGELVLHQKSISVPAERTSDDDPYFYLVACPIHDDEFVRSLQSDGTYNAINNGSMEGYSSSSFFKKTLGDGAPQEAVITAGDGNNGSRGITITSSGTSDTSAAWDTQFFIRAKQVIPIGTKFHLKFDYKASANATVSTQAHAKPSNYIDYAMLGNLDFTTDWQTYEKDIEVTSEMGNGRDANDSKNNSFQSIAFNLWETKTPITYYFDNVEITYPKEEYVSFFCDEPQGLRIKVGEKAPRLKTGFVPGENTFNEYNYPKDNDPVLSIRLAKTAQFMTVQHGTTAESPVAPSAENGPSASEENQLHYLWLPIRNAMTQTATGVIRKAEDYNIYLASTNDPTWDKNIYTAMKDGALPIVGKIVQLYAMNTLGEDDDATADLIAGQNAVNRLCVYFTENFEVREGYNYTLSLPFQEDEDGVTKNACNGTILINLKIVPDYEVWTGAAGNTDWNNDENWRRADGNTDDHTGVNDDELYVSAATTSSPLNGYKTNSWNYRTPKDRIFRKGFAPLYCTHVLIKSDEWGDAPELYDAIDGKGSLQKSPFPNLRDQDNWNGSGAEATATPILRYDMQARLYDIWPDTYGEGVYPNKGREGDLIAEMYQMNSCNEIAFQPSTELLYAHLLNYNNAWVEYQLDNKRWYLLGSPLQGTIAGEWYSPKKTAKQMTTYYDPVTFSKADYDRYNPAIYQRSWDKAKAVLYEVGSTYSTADNPNDLQLDSNGTLPGSEQQGGWNGTSWNATGADEYLDRLGYKPLEGNKANVAIQGIWSNTYNDATVDYTKGGFSVMVMNHLKGDSNDESDDVTIVRLPKEDTMYDYWSFDQNTHGTDTDLGDVRNDLERNLNRGRLKTDLLLPASTQKTEDTDGIYGDLRYGAERTITRVPIKENALSTMLGAVRSHKETISAGVSNLGFYLVENPFQCGLNMDEFFNSNGKFHRKYWLLTSGGQQLVQWATTEWITPTVHLSDGDIFANTEGVVAPGQGFFVEYNPEYDPEDPSDTRTPPTEIVFTKEMQVKTRYGVPSGTPRTFTVEVGQEQKMVKKTVLVDDDEDDLTDPVEVEIDVPETDSDGNPVLTPITQEVEIYNYVQDTGDGKVFPLKARATRGADVSNLAGLVITAQRGGSQSSALVMQRSGASNDFLPSEDTETFITSDLKDVPTVYTLCGRLATTINSIRDFRSLPLGVESASDAPCTLTFNGVELLGDSVAFYDAVEQKLTPLESGMQIAVSGQTQNRYYLVRSLDKKEAADETHLQIFTEGLTAKVIASTAEPILSVRCFDTGGRLVHKASPQSPEYSFSIPIAGVYIIEAETENDHKTVKLIVK